VLALEYLKNCGAYAVLKPQVEIAFGCVADETISGRRCFKTVGPRMVVDNATVVLGAGQWGERGRARDGGASGGE